MRITEEELQRLAELIAEASPEPSGSGFWQIVSGIAIGVLIGIFADFAKRLINHLEARRVAYRVRRQDLRDALEDLRHYTDAYEQDDDLLESYLSVVRFALDAFGDSGYKQRLERLLSDSIPPYEGRNERTTLDAIIEELDEQAQPFPKRVRELVGRVIGRYGKRQEPK